jgi:hypothetical protein
MRQVDSVYLTRQRLIHINAINTSHVVADDLLDVRLGHALESVSDEFPRFGPSGVGVGIV